MNELLKANIDALHKKLQWLLHSYNLSKDIPLNPPYEIEAFDKLENLSSRYARSIDFLVRKVFRSIDEAEFESQGTLIDTVNRANKRGLFENMEDFRKLQMIRNEIVHEYIDDSLPPIFPELLETTPLLIRIIENTLQYGHRLGAK